jgi:hypothetical protein
MGDGGLDSMISAPVRFALSFRKEVFIAIPSAFAARERFERSRDGFRPGGGEAWPSTLHPRIEM